MHPLPAGPRAAGLLAALGLGLAGAGAAGTAAAAGAPAHWRAEFPDTDFSAHAVPLSQFVSGGPPKDGIPAIDDPRFRPVDEITDLGAEEPVIRLRVGDDLRAYPLRILMFHEIVNDTVGGRPVVVTYCPLCNSAAVFDRRIEGRVLDFGTTGKLRHSDLVMYDRQTESWWQQFLGKALVGDLTGAELARLPARIESLESFRAAARANGGGRVLVPRDESARPYGLNPYAGYDSSRAPALFAGDLPDGIAPMARVVAVDGEAWSLELLRRAGTIEHGDLVIRWRPGQNSALDTARIGAGRDVGTVTVARRTEGGLEDVAYDVPFAFAFHAFHPDAPIHTPAP